MSSLDHNSDARNGENGHQARSEGGNTGSDNAGGDRGRARTTGASSTTTTRPGGASRASRAILAPSDRGRQSDASGRGGRGGRGAAGRLHGLGAFDDLLGEVVGAHGELGKNTALRERQCEFLQHLDGRSARVAVLREQLAAGRLESRGALAVDGALDDAEGLEKGREGLLNALEVLEVIRPLKAGGAHEDGVDGGEAGVEGDAACLEGGRVGDALGVEGVDGRDAGAGDAVGVVDGLVQGVDVRASRGAGAGADGREGGGNDGEGEELHFDEVMLSECGCTGGDGRKYYK